jgi:hypothetical protein
MVGAISLDQQVIVEFKTLPEKILVIDRTVSML